MNEIRRGLIPKTTHSRDNVKILPTEKIEAKTYQTQLTEKKEAQTTLLK